MTAPVRTSPRSVWIPMAAPGRIFSVLGVRSTHGIGMSLKGSDMAVAESAGMPT